MKSTWYFQFKRSSDATKKEKIAALGIARVLKEKVKLGMGFGETKQNNLASKTMQWELSLGMYGKYNIKRNHQLNIRNK